MQRKIWVGIVLAVGFTGAQAAIITPTYSTFADLTAAQLPVITFGGSGIGVYGPAAITTFNSIAAAPATPTVLMAMSATPRVSGVFVGAPVTNNGAGTYFAQPGASPALGSNNAAWNFNFAVLGDTRGLTFELYADTNPGVGSDVQLIPGASAFYLGAGIGSAQNTQNSLNLGFAPWDNAVTFDPNINGEYSFSLRAFDGANLVGEVSMQVNVVPEPEAYGLALAGLAVVGLFGLRRKVAPKV